MVWKCTLITEVKGGESVGIEMVQSWLDEAIEVASYQMQCVVNDVKKKKERSLRRL